MVFYCPVGPSVQFGCITAIPCIELDISLRDILVKVTYLLADCPNFTLILHSLQ